MSAEGTLRILAITTVPQTMAAFFPHQLRALSDAGFEVHAASSPGPALDALEDQCGIIAHAIPMERRPSPGSDLISLWRLFRLIRRIRPHVVHAHTPKAGLLGMTAAKLAGVRARLYTVHGLPLLTRSGIRRRILELLERTSAVLSTRTYCVSQSVRLEVITRGLCPEAKTSVLGDGSCAGIDIRRFQPLSDRGETRARVRAAVGIPQSATLVTFVGRIARDKGIGVLAEAWTALTQQLPELCLLIAGEEDTTDPVPLAALTELRQHPSVFWTGSIPSQDVAGIYAATDICVLPTFREGLGQVILEAGAMGVPIVASKVCGVVDAVVEGVTGLLVAPRDSAHLANAIQRLAAQPELRRQLGQAAVENIRAKFSEDRVNQLWLEEYRNLHGEPVASRASRSNQAVVMR